VSNEHRPYAALLKCQTWIRRCPRSSRLHALQQGALVGTYDLHFVANSTIEKIFGFVATVAIVLAQGIMQANAQKKAAKTLVSDSRGTLNCSLCSSLTFCSETLS